MKLKSFIASSFLFVAPIFASNIPLPFNTGETAGGTVAKAGSVDQNYTAGNGSTVYVVGSPTSTWVVPTASAAWISINPTNGALSNSSGYTEDYSVSYFIAKGIDPSSVSLSGVFSVDDNLNNVFVNGVGNGVSASNAWGYFTTFTLTKGFQSGSNTIDFSFTNTGGVGGLLVEFTGATAPEPASSALIGLGLAGLAALRKKLV